MSGVYHTPVMLQECMDLLDIKERGTYIDATAGGGGHSEAIIKRLETFNGKGRLICLDRDSEALEETRKRLEALDTNVEYNLVKADFRKIREICAGYGIHQCDGVLFDLGVSSHQFDEASRGFGYKNEASLDMRMDEAGTLTAQTIVNEFPQGEIAKIIRTYGEERWAARIAEFIVNGRKSQRIETTTQLVEIIKAAIPAGARKTGPHPARRTFQALRIAVNDELDSIREALNSSVEMLKSGGRLCAISYHSLEDRIVKEVFKENSRSCVCPENSPICTCGGNRSKGDIITGKPVIATEYEVMANPRARSAKLRAFVKKGQLAQ